MSEITIDASQMRPDQFRRSVGFVIADLDAIGDVTLPVNVDVIAPNRLRWITLTIAGGYDGQRLALWFTSQLTGDGTNDAVTLPSNVMLGIIAQPSFMISGSGEFDYMELIYCAPASAWAVTLNSIGYSPPSQ